MKSQKGIVQLRKYPLTSGRPEPRRSDRQRDHHHHWALGKAFNPDESPTLQALDAALAKIGGTKS